MRDYYDIYTLMLRYENDFDRDTLKQAFDATCKKRNTTDLDVRGAQIFDIVMHDRFIIYTKDLAFEDGVLYIPIYMTMFI